MESTASPSPSTTSIVNDATRHYRSSAVYDPDARDDMTTSIMAQISTEIECTPYFVDLDSLRSDQIDDLVNSGLLTFSGSSTAAATEDAASSSSSRQHEVCLLRNDKHYQYLSQVWLLGADKQPSLKASFVSLDSSHPWMLYWCLHSIDLLPQQQQPTADSDSAASTTASSLASPPLASSLARLGEEERCAIVGTIEDCWTPCGHAEAVEEASGNSGGFGGGPGQIPHAATSYAAVLTLCILATTTTTDADAPAPSHDAAITALRRVRPALRTWMLSLYCPRTGHFRMHHDGEIDVRATYCLLVVMKLLNLFPGLFPDDNDEGNSNDDDNNTDNMLLMRKRIVQFLLLCQTYEGGFGGEPFNEAHGGYTFCSVASLQLLGAVREADCAALSSWLAARQLPYEGGFSGRTNKLVDGCYSFWQGSAATIVTANMTSSSSSSSSRRRPKRNPKQKNSDGDDDESESGFINDPWLTPEGQQQATTAAGEAKNNDDGIDHINTLHDRGMLQRYILLCAQDVTGGLRDKPSKRRDFYHSCYNLSGLSVSQHYPAAAASSTAATAGQQRATSIEYGHPTLSRLHQTHPVYNIRLERARQILELFSKNTANNAGD